MDPSKILIWNVRGLNSHARQDSVRDLVSVLGSEFTEYVFLPSDGASGGILVAWKNHLRYTGASRVDNHSVSI
jgi:hypothetical protein